VGEPQKVLFSDGKSEETEATSVTLAKYQPLKPTPLN